MDVVNFLLLLLKSSSARVMGLLHKNFGDFQNARQIAQQPLTNVIPAWTSASAPGAQHAKVLLVWHTIHTADRGLQ